MLKPHWEVLSRQLQDQHDELVRVREFEQQQESQREHDKELLEQIKLKVALRQTGQSFAKSTVTKTDTEMPAFGLCSSILTQSCSNECNRLRYKL